MGAIHSFIRSRVAILHNSVRAFAMAQFTVQVDCVDLGTDAIRKIASSNKTMKDVDKNLLCDILMDLGPAYLSIVLATRSSPSNMGNVCVALSESNGDTLYIATNADDANNAQSIMVTLTPEQKDFFDFFNTDLESRTRSLESKAVRKQVRHFAEIYKKPATISKLKVKETPEIFYNRLNSKFPSRARAPEETDHILSGLCDLLHQWQYISAKESAFNLDVFSIEIVALYLAYSGDATSLNDLVNALTVPIAKYLAVRVLRMICEDVCTVHDITDAERDISNAFSGIAGKFKVVQMMRDGLASLGSYTKIVQVHSTGEIASRTGVVHCEVKLYLYLLQNGFDTVVPFHISKQLCMDCAMFFYSNVEGGTRPIFQAAYRDHFSGVACRTACSVVNAAFGNVRHTGCKKGKKKK